MIEEWKIIEDFPMYRVSNTGKVYSNFTGKELKQKFNTRKIRVVVLCSGNGTKQEKSVHRLVAEAFIPNPLNLPCVNHIDENRKNNRADNLEWCTIEYNNQYSENSRPHKVERLGGAEHIMYDSIAEAARANNLSRAHITDCCLGKRKTHGGYAWRYV